MENVRNWRFEKMHAEFDADYQKKLNFSLLTACRMQVSMHKKTFISDAD